MSYILEALKKSQQERELGQVPTLDRPPHLDAPGTSRGAPWPLIAGIFALTALVLALYTAFGARDLLWQVAEHKPIPPSPPNEQKSAPTERHATGVAVNPPIPISAPPQLSQPIMPAPVARKTPKAVIPDKAQEETPTPEPIIRVASDLKKDSADSLEKPPEVEISSALGEMYREIPQTAADTLPPGLAEDIQRFKERMLREQSQPQKSPPAPRPTHAPASTTTSEQAPSVRTLPSEIQSSLPNHRISVHVYASEPQRRFIIIDSTRLQEGDSTSSGLTLQRIEPDGAILEYAGHRFYQPR